MSCVRCLITSCRSSARSTATTGEDPPLRRWTTSLIPRQQVNQQLESHPALRAGASSRGRDAERPKACAHIATVQARRPDERFFPPSEFSEWVRAEPHPTAALPERRIKACQLMQLTSYSQPSSNSDRQHKRVRNVSTQARKNAVRGANTGSSRNNPDGQRSGRIFSRAQIRRLMKNDPEQYEAMQPQIMAAYSEGRVRG